MTFDDDEVIGHDVVRSFVVTGGRTRSDETVDLKFETLVELSGFADRRANLRFERLDIIRVVTQQEVTSVAEISAALGLPILTIQVLVSDLVADQILTAHETHDSEIDLSSLSDIRAAILSL